jgi:hypothetical protein
MQPVNTQLRFNEDGTPRRRYEIDEAKDRKPMVQVTLGLLLAGAVALIKNVLFPARAEQPAAELTIRDLQPPHIYDDVTSVETDAAITEEPITETIDGDAYSVLQTKTNQAMATPYYIAPRQHFSGLSHVSSNDNHLLFGAVPGQAVRLNGEYRDEVRALFGQGAGGSTALPPSRSLLPDPKTSDNPIKPNNPGDHPAGTDPDTVPKGDAGDPELKPKHVNRAPVVSGPVRLGHTTANHIVVFTLADFLTTATDADADPLSISNLSASSGTVVANPDGGWSYTPDPNTHGEATFSYMVSDGQEQVAATAVLTIDPVRPIGGHDHGHEHDHGPVHHHHNHHHRQSYAGTSLHEHGSHPLTAITLILPSPVSASRPIIGTSGNDLIIGTAGNDVISGGGGNDILIGGRGDDAVDGGRGDDTFVATLYDGNDTYDGGAGAHDTLDLQAIHVTTSAERGSAGQAEAAGEDPPPAHLASAVPTAPCLQTSEVPIQELATSDQSRVGGCGGRDTSADCTVDLQAGTADGDLIGHDRLLNIEDVLGGCGNDVIRGDAHANRLSGGGGDDVILGRAGNDVLDGGAGRDIVDGGEGNDIIIATADRAADDIRGGAGSDTYDASCLIADATIDLAHGCATSSEIEIDCLVEIENIIGGRGNDTLIANNSVNFFIGGHGNDLFVFSTAESIGKGEGHHDVILDFAVGDRIDIHNISSEFAHALNNLYVDSDIRDFVFIREQDAFSKPGELKLVYDNVHDASHILGSINYDAMIDFDLEIRGYHLNADFNFHAAAIAS